MSNKEFNVASLIDHTLLKADATEKDIVRLCLEAKKYKFASVCVNPFYVSFAKKNLKGSNVKVCTVIGFPLGATCSEVKAFEAKEAIKNGADEIDMVMNIGALKDKKFKVFINDIKLVRKAAGKKILKVILETVCLTNEEKVKACLLSKEAHVDFVKTSTGFGPHGATVEDVRLMRKIVGDKIGVKASGGIKTFGDAVKMINAGANRIGTSASVNIILNK
ncbi:MAG: deoxyribose-phosphate aldolase [Elusimicrobia bacterium RIFOXYD2_FULL_34_15]|nr:MAG: deoxyribose-phosphate aldolase [Elusimicrobia bacterium RIFOXYD2_FULL_34_15]